jgi:hypothetical protein
MPILDLHLVEFVSGSPAQTARLGERLGRLLRGGEVFAWKAIWRGQDLLRAGHRARMGSRR